MELAKKEIDDFFQNPDLEGLSTIADKRAPLSEQELLEMLCDEVAVMMESRMDYLLSLMYRLDVLEVHINRVLTPGYPEAVNVGLARLILERQKQKIQTKKNYVPPIIEDGWEI
jgi:hypothetical protein